MAPFKLKFRMASGSRSVSQETETEQPSQQLLLNNVTTPINGSITTIYSEQTTDSFGSLNNDQRALIGSNEHSSGEQLGYINPTLTPSDVTFSISISPPPTYEHVMEENRLAALDNENNQATIQHPLMPNEEIVQIIDQDQELQTDHLAQSTSNECTEEGCNQECLEANDTYTYCINSNMTATQSQENFGDCSGSSDPLFGSQHSQSQHSELYQQTQLHQVGSCSGHQSESDEEENQSISEWNPQSQRSNNEINEYIDNKSSKQMYKAAAKEWGITCKMSDGCRCMECQGHYFDCEYDDNDHQKTDGGLGAGTPMFISEVMHGTACNIL